MEGRNHARTADINQWPDNLVMWIFEDWKALVQNLDRSFEESELYEVWVYDSVGMKATTQKKKGG